MTETGLYVYSALSLSAMIRPSEQLVLYVAIPIYYHIFNRKMRHYSLFFMPHLLLFSFWL